MQRCTWARGALLLSIAESQAWRDICETCTQRYDAYNSLNTTPRASAANSTLRPGSARFRHIAVLPTAWQTRAPPVPTKFVDREARVVVLRLVTILELSTSSRSSSWLKQPV